MMGTRHKIIACNSNDTGGAIADRSVDLVITSPPYPMVEMWDECFSLQSDEVKRALQDRRFDDAFEAMHRVLDKTWDDVDRVLSDHGIVCINIGDATKNCDGRFKLFSNHTRVIHKFLCMGYDVLPDIHWHKPTNAPNKFMGSGMYPPCAYVTYEHEYILVFRKGANKTFSRAESARRHGSAYFWEERNVWFSDLWELNGTAQHLKKDDSGNRSGAVPFELAYRLINMYSLKDDWVYDPFSGTGTTLKAAMASERNSIGADMDPQLCRQALTDGVQSVKELNSYIMDRLRRHIAFIDALPAEKKEKLYANTNHPFKVKTRQETELLVSTLASAVLKDGAVLCTYQKADV